MRVFDPERLERVLQRVPGVAGQAYSVTELERGLSNSNLKAAAEDGYTVVVRLWAPGDTVWIDRDAEQVNSRRAAATGVAPPVIAYVPDEGALVTGFVVGRTLSPVDLTDEDTLVRVAAACRTLHAGQSFVSSWDVFAVQRSYLDIVRERGFRLPDGYEEYVSQVAEVERAVGVRADRQVPCNNDLVAANLLDDGEQIWLIDYEYAGDNDPCFELGNLWAESTLSLDRLEVLVDSYYGYPLQHATARARLFGLMANYSWPLWASIQATTSDLDFDFWTWGVSKYERAVAEFDGSGFGRLLEEATLPA